MTDTELQAIRARANAADIPALLAEIAQLRFIVTEYREGMHAAKGALNAEKHRADVAEQERDQLRMQLESLTPGGSEFHDSTTRCIEWISDRLSTTAQQVKARKDAEAKLAAVPVDAIRVVFRLADPAWGDPEIYAAYDTVKAWLESLEVRP